MASSLIGGLIAKQFPADNIIASDINSSQLDALQNQFSIRVQSDNNLAIENADIIILAVKPQIMQTVCRGLTSTQHKPLFISIAAGIRSPDIDRWLGGELDAWFNPIAEEDVETPPDPVADQSGTDADTDELRRNARRVGRQRGALLGGLDDSGLKLGRKTLLGG